MTQTRIPINHFDRGKPFYPLVMQYLAHLIGFRHLLAHGLTGFPDLDSRVQWYVESLQSKGECGDAHELKANAKKLLGKLQLRSEQDDNYLTIEPDHIAREFVANANYLTSYTTKAASSLLILAHELTKDQSYHNREPLWEFLRHCRNAAAHGGHFNLLNREPRRTAEWDTLTITRTSNGDALFKGPSGKSGLLSPGDPIRLLWDIEQRYITS